MKSTRDKLLVILGPTATGKTDLALFLAKKFNGELLAADSRQVYRGLDIGTGKMPSDMSNVKCQMSNGSWEIDGIKIWLYDMVSLDKQYTVADYVRDANRAVNNILKVNKLPIVVGGTGLYIKALLEGLDNLTISIDKKLRKELAGLDLEQLQLRLKQVSPKRWEVLNQSDRQNPRRLIRAIELGISPRRSSLRLAQDHLRGVVTSYDVLKIGLTAPREILYKRADERVLVWFDQGIIKEVEKLVGSGISLSRLRHLGLEYAILADYLDGEIGRQRLIKIVQEKIHGYIRRQLTWFKKEKGINWFDITSVDYDKKVEKLITSWYDQHYNAKKN